MPATRTRPSSTSPLGPGPAWASSWSSAGAISTSRPGPWASSGTWSGPHKIKPLIGTPKTARASRRISLSKESVASLKAHRHRQTERGLELGSAYRSGDLVFPSEDGSLQDPRLVLFRFKTLVKRFGVPALTFHDLRHTHATLLLAGGVHPKVVQERLGHASITVTMDIYSHVLPSIQEAAAAKIDEILDESGHRKGTK